MFENGDYIKMEQLGQIRKLVLTALFAALMCIAGMYLILPIGPVPITLANMFAIAAGMMLGPVYGGAAVLVYLLMGTLGLPVFSRNGGFAYLLGPTGGYLLGYLLGAIFAGVLAALPAKLKRAKFLYIAAALAGFALIYLPGLLVLQLKTGFTWQETLSKGMLPFIPGDLLKAAVATASVWVLRPQMDS